jgi:hypothetical protein
VHLEVDDGGSPMRAMLTVKGYGLVGATEDALLEASMHTRAPG